MKNDEALRQRKGWAWVIGVCPLAALPMFESGVADERRKDALRNRLATSVLKSSDRIRNKSLRDRYSIVHQLFEDLNSFAMTRVQVPRTLAAFRRETGARERIEAAYYREFLLSGTSVAETLVFAARLGLWAFAEGGGKNDAKDLLLERYSECARTADLDFAAFQPLFEAYFDGKILGKTLVDQATEAFFKLNADEKGMVRRVWAALDIRPGVFGVSLDIKKLQS